MTWEELVDEGRRYNVIIITGCQRTGTTYMAEELSRVLGYEFIDERIFGPSNMEQLLRFVYEDTDSKVIQAPALLHRMGEVSDDVLKVMITRDENDVAKSMLNSRFKNNLTWFSEWGKIEYNKFKDGDLESPQELYRTKIEFGRSIGLKEIQYDELKKTEGYVEDRSHFGIKQTK